MFSCKNRWGFTHRFVLGTITSHGATLSYLLAALSPALYGVVAARLLGPTDRGYLVGALSGVSVIAIVGTLGVGTALRNRSGMNHLQHSGRHILISGIVGFLFGCLLGGILAVVAHYPQPLVNISLIGVLCATSSMAIIFREILISQGRLSYVYVLAAIQVLLQIPLLIGLGPSRLNYLITLGLFSAAAIVHFIFLWHLLRSIPSPARQDHRQGISLRERSSVVSLVSAQFLNGGDRVVAAVAISPQALAQYSVGASIALLPVILMGAAYQEVQNKAASKGKIWTSGLWRRLALVGLLSGLTFAFMPFLIEWIFGSVYAPGIVPGRIMALVVPFLIALSISNAILLGARQYWGAAAAMGTALLIGVVGIFALRDLEEAGVAISYVVAVAGASLISWFVTSRRLRF